MKIEILIDNIQVFSLVKGVISFIIKVLHEHYHVIAEIICRFANLCRFHTSAVSTSAMWGLNQASLLSECISYDSVVFNYLLRIVNSFGKISMMRLLL